MPTIPFYIYYSMFGFQRVGDMVWACGDMMTRGFLLGGPAGRTTLNGEGLQHQDGHSLILASSFPCLTCYDPSFAYEVAVIVRVGIRRMYQEQENVFYYLTLYNQNRVMPPLVELDREQVIDGIVAGGYCWQRSEIDVDQSRVVQSLSSGSIMQEAIAAAQLLEVMGMACNLWSMASFTELAREAQAADRLCMHGENVLPRVTQMFSSECGVAVAATDYMQALPLSISQWMPLPYHCLGTDGFGISEDRQVGAA